MKGTFNITIKVKTELDLTEEEIQELICNLDYSLNDVRISSTEIIEID